MLKIKDFSRSDKLSCVFPEWRDPSRIVHSLADMIRARIFAIACGYEDGNDLDRLRNDPAFKLACGRLPDTDRDLCSQPTLSRLENAPCLREVIRLSYALVELWMDSYERAPSMVTLDIDDTVDVVHGRQQLSLFNAHYDERCFLPIHVYDTERSGPVAIILRPGKTPSGVEVRAHLRRLVRHIRRRWPNTHITFRGDGHYACPEAMTWCEQNGIDYVFGLAGTKPLARKVDEASDAVRTKRAVDNQAVVRGYTEPAMPPGPGIASAASSPASRRPNRGSTSVTSSPACASARRVDLRQSLLRPWTGREPDQAAQVPTRLRPHQLPLALANQVRLVLHTAAYWLILTVRDAIPKPRDLATPSSQRSGSGFSKSPPVSPRRPAAFVSPSRQLVPSRSVPRPRQRPDPARP